MIGSSVVPGLPNILTTPSSLSTRRKASRPVMVLVLVTGTSGILFPPWKSKNSAPTRSREPTRPETFRMAMPRGLRADVTRAGRALPLDHAIKDAQAHRASGEADDEDLVVQCICGSRGGMCDGGAASEGSERP